MWKLFNIFTINNIFGNEKIKEVTQLNADDDIYYSLLQGLFESKQKKTKEYIKNNIKGDDDE